MMARSARHRLAVGASILLLLCLLLTTTLLHSMHRAGDLPHTAPHTVGSLTHGASLSTLMRKWASVGGGASRELRRRCAEATPADAVRGVLGAFERGVVVDVGANGGFPASAYALRAGARVISIEPDERNLVRLRRLSMRLKDAKQHTVVAAAAGSTPATMRMAFHRQRNDFTCFRCLRLRSNDIYTRNVRVVTVDDTLRTVGVGVDAPGRIVRLLKSDTQGHELEVIRGARQAFASGAIRAALIEFDPNLLGRKNTALTLLSTLHEHGMRCVHLKFGGKRKQHASRLRSFNIRNSRRSEERFYEFVKNQGGWTDLLCIRVAQ